MASTPRAFPTLIATTLALASFGLAGRAVATTTGSRPIVITRGGPHATVPFRTHDLGEEIVDITAGAPGVSWQDAASTSAVVRVSVDGRYATDDVVMESTLVTRSFDLGPLFPGRHTLTLQFDTRASSAGAVQVEVTRTHFHTAVYGTREWTVLSHSPILYGRNIDNVAGEPSGPYQNASTDTPLVAWHEETPAATPGDTVLLYSIVWSNEDGGTSTPALMARWGRTTDIEWIYQVEVDSSGTTVPGTAVFQSPNHGTEPFTGRYEFARPQLQTCTLNNNVCDVVDDPMRFSLSTEESLDATTHAREQVMDANPWTYRVMAQEVRREGKVVANPDPTQTTLIADPTNYLYLVVRKRTVDPPNTGVFWVGVAIGVQLKGDPTLYRSDEGMHPDWSLERDDPAATTVQLPPGTRPSDIAEIDAIRVPFGPDTGATVHVAAVNRAFFLGRSDEPHASFFSGRTPAVLTAAAPSAVLYRAR
jgi:hypothetical protein